MATTIHRFGSTAEAYDACQCDPDIKTGDVLIIAPEGVVGIAGTWPVAVTQAHGEFHRVAQWTAVPADQAFGIPCALAEAMSLDFPLASKTRHATARASNAQLAASAPDLLLALKAIVDEAGPRFGHDDTPGCVNRMARIAREAIARATR